MENSNFKFFIPFEINKGKDTAGNEQMIIEGIASTKDEDSDGEFLDPAGYELDYFKKFGFLNWQHRTSSDPASIVGEPIEARIQDNKLYIKGKLFNDNPLAKAIYQLGSNLQTSGSTKRLGFSIEGKALERDLLNPKIVKKARITGIAITPTPKNANTFMNICKGEYSEEVIDDDEQIEDELKKLLSTTSGSALIPESLEENQKKLTKSEVFEKIFTTFPDINLDLSKSMYNFFVEVQTHIDPTMENTISPEAIEAARQILKAVSSDLTKAEGNITTPSAPTVQIETATANGATQNDFYRKICDITSSMISKASKEEITTKVKAEMGDDYDEAQMDKAYDECKMKKAMEEEEEMKKMKSPIEMKKAAAAKLNAEIAELEKAEKESTPVAQDDVILEKADEILDFLKSQSTNMDSKFQAAEVLYKASTEQVNLMKGMVETLTKRMEEIENTPIGKKSVSHIGFLQKGESNSLAPQHPAKVIAVSDKISIVKALEECIDIEKSEESLVNDFIRYEATGILTKSLVNELNRAGYALS